ncbi:hypothetical protein RhiJN_26953 [Ceratobasidium sp. AG-Ba]|nr:hypothetical protein RhiJN_26953 [Ceratobasidium sp. AG-Ba]
MHDPNFPPDLSIQPSVSSGSPSKENLAFSQDVDIKKYGIAGRIWEAAYTLAVYITPPPVCPTNSNTSNPSSLPLLEFDPPCSLFQDCIRPTTVVEVGSGTGYAGIHVARQLDSLYCRENTCTTDANVIVTDLENVVSLLEKGIKEHGHLTGVSIRLEAHALEWGNPVHADQLARRLKALRRNVTHVLCSDLVYFPHLYPHLMRTLLTLTSPPFCDLSLSLEVIIGYRVRSLTKEIPFWQVFGTWFSFAPVLARRLESEGAGTAWGRFGAANDTHVFVANRRPESYMWSVPTEDSQLMNGFGPSPPRLDDTFESLLLLEIDTDD